MSIGSTINNNLAVQGNLDVSGGIIYFSQQQLTSQQQFQNIQLNTSAQGYLSFPYYDPLSGSTNAFKAYTNCDSYIPVGLGIIWDYNPGQGEVDLIGYGGSGPSTGGISIYSYNTNNDSSDASYNIADFWPGGSTIYTGLDISGNGNLTVGSQTNPLTTNLYGNLNFVNYYGGTITSLNNTTYTNLTIDASNVDISGNLFVGSDTNYSSTNLWGTLYLLNTDYNIAKISFGPEGSGALSCNNLVDNNLYMNTGLDISGNLIFTQPTNAMNGIQLNNQSEKYVYFPSTTNALNPYSNLSGYTPFGLGITWSNLSQGETDLIGYGGGSSTSGGVSIYSYNTNGGADNPTHIADFWPTGSNIYTGLNVGITNTSSSTTNLWGNLNVRGLLSTLTYNASGGGMATNIGIYTYGASIVSSTNTNYGFNILYACSGILIVNTNNYSNYSTVYSFAGVNGGTINLTKLTTTNGSINAVSSSTQSPASIYVNVTTGSAYGGGNIYFTIIGNEPTGLVNLSSLF